VYAFHLKINCLYMRLRVSYSAPTVFAKEAVQAVFGRYNMDLVERFFSRESAPTRLAVA